MEESKQSMSGSNPNIRRSLGFLIGLGVFALGYYGFRQVNSKAN
tara:strand:+ start:113 stop:244 length:132 start_codon:yes stop_codon:yes gene_type:complete